MPRCAVLRCAVLQMLEFSERTKGAERSAQVKFASFWFTWSAKLMQVRERGGR